MALGDEPVRRGRLPKHHVANYRAHLCSIMVGDRVKVRRLAEGWSQTELADRAVLSKKQVQNCEDGRAASLFVLVSLADALDCTLDDLCPVGWDSV